MCDKLVFDLATEIEGSPNIFVKKDFLNILDNQNGNYSANQSVVDTSQLSNSNKFLSYKEAYLSIPLLITVTSAVGDTFAPATAASSADYCVGLKNWFGTVIHSFTLDYNGTTIIQQTPFINMWNSFKLMTTLSWADVATIGSTIGFYPDDPLSFGWDSAPSTSGVGVSNNTNFSPVALQTLTSGVFNAYKARNGNAGFLARQRYINFDQDGEPGNTVGQTYANLLPNASATALWKSRISTKINAVGVAGVFQISVRATVYLKHLHSFFQRIPLLKGVYMKMTMNLNNSSATFTVSGAGIMTLTGSSVPVGGVQPLMISSRRVDNGGVSLGQGTYSASLSVGERCLNSAQSGIVGVANGVNGGNIFLYVPAYTFNGPFLDSYLSNPVKNIEYSDVYQYQILNTNSQGFINSLLTNGLANVKSVLLLPFFTEIVPGSVTQAEKLPPFQSPFDPAGSGCTSPLVLLNNFNVVVSGQNAIYNTIRYSADLFNQQVYGCNAVNGGMTDGLTSSLIDSLGWEMEYCYHYVNVERMLPIEQTVPKSIQIIGQNQSAKPINLICFVEYSLTVSINLMSGARV
jgi:hypothetical protein